MSVSAILGTCRFPLVRGAPNASGGFAGELTRLNCKEQFKPFVYLNGRTTVGNSPNSTGEPLSRQNRDQATRIFPSNSSTCPRNCWPCYPTTPPPRFPFTASPP